MRLLYPVLDTPATYYAVTAVYVLPPPVTTRNGTDDKWRVYLCDRHLAGKLLRALREDGVNAASPVLKNVENASQRDIVDAVQRAWAAQGLGDNARFEYCAPPAQSESAASMCSMLSYEAAVLSDAETAVLERVLERRDWTSRPEPAPGMTPNRIKAISGRHSPVSTGSN